MNLYSAVRLSGVCVAALTAGVLTSACGTSSDSEEVQLSSEAPADGLGSKWMQEGSDVNMPGLGSVAGATEEAPSQYNGIGMFEQCVFLIGDEYGATTMEVALVRNDDTESIAQRTGLAVMGDIRQFLEDNAQACA